MLETIDAGLVFNSIITAAMGVALHFVKSWKAELGNQLNELYDDIKKLREDIFSLSLKEESMKGTYYSLFAKQEDVATLRQRVDTLRERIIKLEALGNTSILNRRAGDVTYAAPVSAIA